MARILNHHTGCVDEVPDAIAPAYEAMLERLTDLPPAFTLGLPPDAGSLLDGTVAAARSLAGAQTPKRAELAARGTAAAASAWQEAIAEHEAPPAAPRRRRDRRLIVPWPASTCAKVRAGLPPRYRAVVDTGQGLGLRFGELSALALEDLDRGGVLVRRQVKRVDSRLVWAPPKDGSSGRLPFDRNLSATLRDHFSRFPAASVTLPWNTPDGRRETFRILFPTISGAPLDRSYFTRIWQAAVTAAGMTPSRSTGTHQLRHHFASELVGKGTDLETVRRLLRHADLLTTQNYVHSLAISDRQSRRAIGKITPRAKSADGDELAVLPTPRTRKTGS